MILMGNNSWIFEHMHMDNDRLAVIYELDVAPIQHNGHPERLSLCGCVPGLNVARVCVKGLRVSSTLV